MTNREKLQRLMLKHRLKPAQVSEILDASEDTVTSWLRPESNKSSRNMPNAKLRLLEILCQAEQHNRQAVKRMNRS